MPSVCTPAFISLFGKGDDSAKLDSKFNNVYSCFDRASMEFLSFLFLFLSFFNSYTLVNRLNSRELDAARPTQLPVDMRSQTPIFLQTTFNFKSLLLHYSPAHRLNDILILTSNLHTHKYPEIFVIIRQESNTKLLIIAIKS